MNKRKTSLVIVISLVVLLLSVILGYTYSKYTTSKEVRGSTSVATWSFDGAISNTESTTTKLISLADTVSKDSIVTGKIAPGTNGSFKIIINASGSEVDVDYDVLLKDEENSKPSNLYFTCEDLKNARDEKGQLIKYYSLSDMLKVDDNNRSNMSGKIINSENKTPKVITVNWDWPYETTKEGVLQDTQDTNDSGIVNYSFSLNIIGKQTK